jgi:flagellar FliJ protein
MARFVFKLEGVLRHRANIEQQRRRELATVEAQMASLEAQLRALDAAVRASETDLRENRLVGRLDMAFLAAHRRYAISMQRKAMATAQKMAGMQRQLETARQNLAEAAKQRKIIEKLRDRQLTRWKAEQARHELMELDEIAMRLSYQNGLEESSVA